MKDEFYDIEIKCLITEEKYNQLVEYLNKNFRLEKEYTTYSTKFVPGDVRLYKTGDEMHVVCKEQDLSKVGRKEIKIPVANEEDFNAMHDLFIMLGLKQAPSWIKHKKEFIFPYKGYNYTVCLEHIEGFGHILKVVILSDTNNFYAHEPNIKDIIKELGCEPVNPVQLLQKVKEFEESHPE